MPHTHLYELKVSTTAIDANGHANNVEYLHWMQQAATSHADAIGCTTATLAAGATWVVRSHHIEYLRPAFADEGIEVRTWVENVRRALSLRKYEIVRQSDGVVLARAETDWIFVDVTSGRARSIPPQIQALFELQASSD